MEKKWHSTSLPYVLPNTGDQADAWTQTQGTQELLEVTESTPAPQIETALQLSEGQRIVVRRRLMRLNGQPVELVNSYYPGHIAHGTGLAEPRKIRGGAPTLLARLGYSPGRVSEVVEARGATAMESTALAINEGDPVLTLSRVTFSTDDRPVEYSQMIMRQGARLHYEIEV